MYGETRARTPLRSTLASTLSRHSTYSIPSIQSCCGRRKGTRWSLEGSSEGRARSPSSVSPRAGATNQCQPRNIPDKSSKINAILRPLSLYNALDAVNTNRCARKRFESGRCIGRRISREHRNTLRSRNGYQEMDRERTGAKVEATRGLAMVGGYASDFNA